MAYAMIDDLRHDLMALVALQAAVQGGFPVVMSYAMAYAMIDGSGCPPGSC
jgi:hypothetical protein